VLEAPATSLPLDRFQKCLEFLAALPFVHAAHSGSTYLCHLIRTQQLLASWGCDEYLCFAGMFHSIYGTESLEQAVVDSNDREEVVSLVGADAEELVYLYSSMSLDSFWSGVRSETSGSRILILREGKPSWHLGLHQHADLCHLVAANSLDIYIRQSAARWFSTEIRMLMLYLNPRARRYLECEVLT